MVRLHPGLVSMTAHGSGLLIRLGFLLSLLHFTTPAVVGHFGLLSSIEAVSIYFAGLEFHTFTARRYTKAATPRRLRILMRAHVFLIAITAPAAALIGALATVVLHMNLPGAVVAWFAILLVAGAIAQEASRYLILRNRPVSAVILSVLRTAAWQPLALLLLLLGEPPVLSMVGCWASVTLLATAWALWTLRVELVARSHFRVSYIRAGLWKARTYYGITALSVLQGNLERFLLQLFMGPASVGIFSYFQTLANTTPSLIQTAILNLSLPHLLAKFGRKTPDRWEYLRQIEKRCGIAALAVALAIFAAAVPLTILVSKQQYRSGLWMLPILLLAQIFIVWTQPNHLALYAAHKDRVLLGFSVLALSCSAGANLSLIPLVGIAGATVAPLVVAGVLAWARARSMRSLRAEESH